MLWKVEHQRVSVSRIYPVNRASENRSRKQFPDLRKPHEYRIHTT
jgi:hypothetical protein